MLSAYIFVDKCTVLKEAGVPEVIYNGQSQYRPWLLNFTLYENVAELNDAPNLLKSARTANAPCVVPATASICNFLGWSSAKQGTAKY